MAKMRICLFHCVGCYTSIDVLDGPRRELMFSSRAAYARSMLLTRAYADRRAKRKRSV